MEKTVKKELEIGGKSLTLETGFLAKQANGAVLATYGETVVLATVVSQAIGVDAGYFPLSVDYEEKLYAGGKISTSRFIKRETRPTEVAVLTSRLIDRSIRPLFPKDYLSEVQVIITVLSVDLENDPDVIALVATSAALAISDIPWNGPLSGLRIAPKDGKFVVNPTNNERELADLELVVATNKSEVVMIEAGGNEADEKLVSEGLDFAVKEGQKIIKLIEDFTKEVGGTKEVYKPNKAEKTTEEKIRKHIKDTFYEDFKEAAIKTEGWFGEAVKTLEEKFSSVEEKISPKILADVLDDEIAKFLRHEILTNKKRPDGRSPDDIREVTIKVGVLPRTHGSAIFQRGDTQALSIATLGSPALEQLIESMEGEKKKRYMHHYNFPPFSVGEARRRGAPGRRELGHGALAEKAVRPVLPSSDVFPYTIRVVSEILSSAGSTSQASVCGSTLALMDAGVPIKEPVAGISIGLVTDKSDKTKYVTLTDIAYQEDAQGDMDFKVAGTKNGITAIQMDIKLDGIPTDILKVALDKAKKARLELLAQMFKAIPSSRETVSEHAPTVVLVKIDPSKIGEVIGSGGRTINKIITETGAAIDINDEGIVTISSKDREACQKAAKWVEGIVKEPQIGEEFEGPVKRILNFGAMIEYMPGKDGLVHISRLAPYRVEKVEDVVKVGQNVKVRVSDIDDQGRINLSMIFGNEPQDGQARQKNTPEGSGPDRRQDRGNHGRDRNRRGPRH